MQLKLLLEGRYTKQDVARRLKFDRWALDVIFKSAIIDELEATMKHPTDDSGVYVHGLCLMKRS